MNEWRPDPLATRIRLQARRLVAGEFGNGFFAQSSSTSALPAVAAAMLIEARNNLVARLFLTALSTALLVVFVVVAQPKAYALLAGAVLYAVGAIVGLFGRLYADLRGKSFFGDFGYSHVQLVQTFLVSGLAAVAGVYLAVALPSQAPRPSDGGSEQSHAVPSVLSIYDLEQYPQGIGVAALFGLAPGLLVSRLSQGVEQYKEDLRSSEPTPAPHSSGT